ncbi:hypothetical protein GH714_024079 [Hevea brasiliensis]|uniref:C3H1-type domain-containing protein n=1 Tax=Hevea brasiliensis TaxID=3981 RepID=A0A6A6LAS8_HEVBR|nr:hypothetical protein GH714_024079 [Hevea brasiliensis]
MELYGRNHARNGSQSGQQPEWSPVRGETGLEESMWRLGLASSELYPERPGVPDCVYYMRTGFCGYGGRCRYNHPRNRAAVEAAVRATGEYPERVGEPPCQAPVSPVLSPGAQPAVGATSLYGVTQLSSSHLHLPDLTRRPLLLLAFQVGVQPCAFYLQNGNCKFGATCKFDHPMATVRYSPSTSSLIDMPVSPYPVGSLLATLVPSSSSAELRPELIGVTKKDPYLSRIPPSGNTSSNSVGLIFSQTGSLPLPELQHSIQSSVPLAGGRSTRQGGEVRHSS